MNSSLHRCVLLKGGFQINKISSSSKGQMWLNKVVPLNNKKEKRIFSPFIRLLSRLLVHQDPARRVCLVLKCAWCSCFARIYDPQWREFFRLIQAPQRKALHSQQGSTEKKSLQECRAQRDNPQRELMWEKRDRTHVLLADNSANAPPLVLRD